MSRRAPAGAFVLAVIGGLLVAAGTAADWVVADATREVAGVEVEEIETTAGIDLVPALVPLGLAVVPVALAVPLTRGRARRAGGVALVALGAAALVLGGVGLARALGMEGGIGSGPALSLLGAAGVVAAGGLALLPSRAGALLGERYTVEGDTDDEWRMASAEDED